MTNSLSFVYLNSSLERLYAVLGEQLPVNRFFLEQTDDLWSIAWDVRMLERIHHHMAHVFTAIDASVFWRSVISATVQSVTLPMCSVSL